MREGKKATAKKQFAKKSVSNQKFREKKLRKVQSKPIIQIDPLINKDGASSLIKKVGDFIVEIENKPIINFEKKDRGKIIEHYEKLMLKIVREINSSK